MEEFGKSALIAITGLMASAILVAGGVVLAPPDDGPLPVSRSPQIAALPVTPPVANWPNGPTPPLDSAALPVASSPHLAIPKTPGGFPDTAPGAGAGSALAKPSVAAPPRMAAFPAPKSLAARPKTPTRTASPKTPAHTASPKTPARIVSPKAEPKKIVALAPGSKAPAVSGAARVQPVPVERPKPPTPPDTLVTGESAKRGPGLRNGTVPPWRKYAALTTVDEGLPMVAIVIDDLGLNARRMARTIALPRPLTLAILPYGNGLPPMAAKARAAGHELLVHLPMEPRDSRENPGRNALLVDLGRSEIERRILWNLSRFEGFVGVNNHMGSRFTAHEAGLEPLMLEIRKRGLLFLDSVTSGASVAGDLARSYGIPSAKRDIFLDNEISTASIEKQLALVERCARRRGQCIAIGHPHKETLEVLRRWLPTLKAKGFNLVPISAIIARRQTG